MDETIYWFIFITNSRDHYSKIGSIMRILAIIYSKIFWNKFQPSPYFKSKEITIFYFSVESKNCPSEHISLYSEKAH